MVIEDPPSVLTAPAVTEGGLTLMYRCEMACDVGLKMDS